jgi:hypothetical protein
MRGQLEPNVCCSIIWERKNRGKGQRGKRPECRGHSHLNVRVLEVDQALECLVLLPRFSIDFGLGRVALIKYHLH